MTLLISVFWPGLAGAAALGLAVGWLAGWPARPAVPASLAAVAVCAATAAATGIVPGVPGLWLEGAALLLPAYLAACAGAALLRSGIGPRPLQQDRSSR